MHYGTKTVCKNKIDTFKFEMKLFQNARLTKVP